MAGVLGEGGHECEQVDAFEVEVVAGAQSQLVVQAESDALDFVVLVEQHQVLVLPVALQHRDVLHLAVEHYEPFVELEAGVEVPPFGEGVYLLDLVTGLVAAAAVLDPVQKHRVVEAAYGGRHELCQAGVDYFLGVVVEVALEEAADASNDHLLLIALGVQVARVLLEQHYWVVQQFFLRGLVHEVVSRAENRVVLYAVAEVLNRGGFHLFILYENGEANVVKLPSTVDGEVLVDGCPQF